VSPLAFLDIGFGELLIVGFVGLVLYGGRLPEMMRTLGGSYRKLRRSVEDLARDVSSEMPKIPSLPYRPGPPASSDALPRTPPPPPPPPATPKTPATGSAARPADDDAPPV
jgi:sec-independent protein translocase protein TatA